MKQNRKWCEVYFFSTTTPSDAAKVRKKKKCLCTSEGDNHKHHDGNNTIAIDLGNITAVAQEGWHHSHDQSIAEAA
eukprot:3345928-Ditylum_brightwellii.AAC.1